MSGHESSSAAAAAAESPLPEGWMEAKTDNGRVYYFNKITRQTQWTRPGAGADLPEGWRLVTTRDGKDFYLNTLTNKTQWGRPTQPATADAEKASTTAAAAQQEQEHQKQSVGTSSDPSESSPAEERKTQQQQKQQKRPSSSVAPAAESGDGAAPEDEEEEEPLPEGWEKRKTAEGQTFYLHAKYRKSQWRRPTQQDTERAQQASVWVEKVDPKSGRTYYVHKETKKAVWHIPGMKRSPSSSLSRSTSRSSLKSSRSSDQLGKSGKKSRTRSGREDEEEAEDDGEEESGSKKQSDAGTPTSGIPTISLCMRCRAEVELTEESCPECGYTMDARDVEAMRRMESGGGGGGGGRGSGAGDEEAGIDDNADAVREMMNAVEEIPDLVQLGVHGADSEEEDDEEEESSSADALARRLGGQLRFRTPDSPSPPPILETPEEPTEDHQTPSPPPAAPRPPASDPEARPPPLSVPRPPPPSSSAAPQPPGLATPDNALKPVAPGVAGPQTPQPRPPASSPPATVPVGRSRQSSRTTGTLLPIGLISASTPSRGGGGGGGGGGPGVPGTPYRSQLTTPRPHTLSDAESTKFHEALEREEELRRKEDQDLKRRQQLAKRQKLEQEALLRLSKMREHIRQTAEASTQVIFEGRLKKESPKVMGISSWQTRYFRLFPDSLQYFKSKTDKNYLGIIPLFTVRHIRTAEEGSKKKSKRFDIFMELDDGGVVAARVFSLLADSPELCDQWASVLQKNCTRLRPDFDEAAFQELSKSSQNQKIWKDKDKLLQIREDQRRLDQEHFQQAANQLQRRQFELEEESEFDVAIRLVRELQTQETGPLPHPFGRMYLSCERQHPNTLHLLHQIPKTGPGLDAVHRRRIRWMLTRTAHLHHPFLMRPLYRGETLDSFWAVYQPAIDPDKHSLRTLLREYPEGFPLEVVKWWGSQLLLGLGYLHSMEESGHSLSPRSLFIDGLGNLVFGDPLLCLPPEEVPESHLPPEYWSPEALQDTEAFHAPDQALRNSQSADWWRFGLLLFELATGSSPILNRIRTEPQETRTEDATAADDGDGTSSTSTAGAGAAGVEEEEEEEKNLKAIHRAIRDWDVEKDLAFPDPIQFPESFQSLIRRLLHQDPEQRIGSSALLRSGDQDPSSGCQECAEADFFQFQDWRALQEPRNCPLWILEHLVRDETGHTKEPHRSRVPDYLDSELTNYTLRVSVLGVNSVQDPKPGVWLEEERQKQKKAKKSKRKGAPQEPQFQPCMYVSLHHLHNTSYTDSVQGALESTVQEFRFPENRAHFELFEEDLARDRRSSELVLQLFSFPNLEELQTHQASRASSELLGRSSVGGRTAMTSVHSRSGPSSVTAGPFRRGSQSRRRSISTRGDGSLHSPGTPMSPHPFSSGLLEPTLESPQEPNSPNGQPSTSSSSGGLTITSSSSSSSSSSSDRHRRTSSMDASSSSSSSAAGEMGHRRNDSVFQIMDGDLDSFAQLQSPTGDELGNGAGDPGPSGEASVKLSPLVGRVRVSLSCIKQAVLRHEEGSFGAGVDLEPLVMNLVDEGTGQIVGEIHLAAVLEKQVELIPPPVEETGHILYSNFQDIFGSVAHVLTTDPEDFDSDRYSAEYLKPKAEGDHDHDEEEEEEGAEAGEGEGEEAKDSSSSSSSSSSAAAAEEDSDDSESETSTATSPAGTKQQQKKQSTTTTTGTTGPKDVPPLPEGWKELRAENGRPYYYHKESGKTQWSRPMLSSRELPPGWQQLSTPEGRVYYYNEATKKTQWEAPTTTESPTPRPPQPPSQPRLQQQRPAPLAAVVPSAAQGPAQSAMPALGSVFSQGMTTPTPASGGPRPPPMAMASPIAAPPPPRAMAAGIPNGKNSLPPVPRLMASTSVGSGLMIIPGGVGGAAGGSGSGRGGAKRNIRGSYTKDGFKLNLSYITNSVIAMGCPRTPPKNAGDPPLQPWENDIHELQRFFAQTHPGVSYLVVNLCSDLEPEYPKSSLKSGHLIRMPFSEHNAPPFPLMLEFCLAATRYFATQTHGVLAVHCSEGIDKTGLMISALLLFQGRFHNAKDAINHFANHRTDDGRAVVLKSQQRYLEYFYQYLRSHELSRIEDPIRRVRPLEEIPLRLKSIRLSPIPRNSYGELLLPYFKCRGAYPTNRVLFDLKQASQGRIQDVVFHKKKKDYCDITVPHPDSILLQQNMLGGEITQEEASAFQAILYGDVKLTLYYKDDRFKTDHKLFHFWFNTAFVKNNYLVLKIQDLDLDIDDRDGRILGEKFGCQLFFSTVQ